MRLPARLLPLLLLASAPFAPAQVLSSPPGADISIANPFLISGNGFAGVSDEEAGGVDQVNLRRTQIGLNPVARNNLIDAAARGHSDYLSRHNLTGHVQSQSQFPAGFTGTSFSDRLRAVGYNLRTGNEVISAGSSSATGSGAIEGLIQAIYHRYGIFATSVDEIGVGYSNTHPSFTYIFTANFGSTRSPLPTAPAGWVGVYPFDGQTAIPIDFFSDTESPDPVADADRVGYPISLHVDDSKTLVINSFTVRDAAGISLPVKLLSKASDPFTPASVASIIPLSALSYGTTYTAQFAGSASGVALNKSWTFTTVPLTDVSFAPANPTAGIGITFLIKLSGGSGSYGRVGFSNSNVIGLRFASSNSLEVTTKASGTSTITVTDSEGRTASTRVTVQAGAGTPVDTPAATAPTATLSASALDFGTTEASSRSAAKAVSLSNKGSASLSISGLSSNSSEFVLTHDCGTSLAAGASCTLSVVFAPNSTGSKSGSITLSSNAAGSPQRIALTGTGIVTAISLPFSASAVASGSLTQHSLNATLKAATPDVGGQRSIFVAAVAGDRLFVHNGIGWLPYSGSINDLPSFASGPLATSTAVAILSNFDISSLCGTAVFVGYGQSASEMLQASRYQLVHTLCR